MGGNRPDPSKHVVVKWKPVQISARHIRRYIKVKHLSLVDLDRATGSDVIDHCFEENPIDEGCEYREERVEYFRYARRQKYSRFSDKRPDEPVQQEACEVAIENSTMGIDPSLIKDVTVTSFVGKPEEVIPKTLDNGVAIDIAGWTEEEAIPAYVSGKEVYVPEELNERFDIRIPTKVVQFYIDKDIRNNPNNLRNGPKLKQILRVYHIAHSGEEFIPGVKPAETSRDERYLVPEQWVNKFAHDPLGANGNLEVPKRNNLTASS